MIEAGRRVAVLVGVLVVVVGATLGAMLIFIGSATRLFSSTVHVSACFADVTGLRSGAPVLLSGVSVGAVADISLGEPCRGAAKVDLALDSHAMPRLPGDTHAKLVTMGLLGDRVVALAPGRANAHLRAGAVIEGQVPIDPAAVIAQAGQAFDTLTRIARRVDDTLAGADLKSALNDLVGTTASLRHLVEGAEHGPGLLHTLLFDPALARQVRSVGPAAQKMATAATGADQTLAHLDRAAGNVEEIVGYVKSGQGTLGGVIYDPAIYEDLRTIVGGVRRNVILRTLGRFVLKHH